MKKVIVTGSTGFLGSNLARRLLHDGHEVWLLLHSDANAWRIEGIRRDVRVCVVDLCDKDRVNEVVSSIQPDWVFHLAAHGAYSWQKDIEAIINTNLWGTINLVNASERVGFEAFINAGSSSEYGYKDHAPGEMERIEPNSYYAVAKGSATLFCNFIARKENLNISTLRLYSAYGPFEDPRRLIPALILNGLNNKFPPLVNPGVARDFVFSEDVIDAFLLAAQRSKEPGAVYNVGTGIQTKISEIVAISRRLLQISTEPVWGSMPDREWDTTVWVADNSYIQHQLGWVPRHSIEDGLRLTIEWFRSNFSTLPL